MWQSAPLVSPTSTLNRDAVPMVMTSSQCGESRVDVKTGNEEEESLEVGLLTLEVFQKNPTRREVRELEDCGYPVHKNWRGACV